MFLTVLDMVMVVALGSESYADRLAADDALARRGWRARAALESGKRSADPEVRHRCESLYDRARGSVLASFEPAPFIDGAWFDAWPRWWTGDCVGYSPSGASFQGRYGRMVPFLDLAGRDSYPYDSYRAATRLWLLAEIESGADLGELEQLVAEMRQRDEVFLRRIEEARRTK